MFHHANNTVVRGGTFYATNNLVVKHDQTPQGIVEGADVVCFDNGHLTLKNSLQQLTRHLQVYSRGCPPEERNI